MAAIAVVSVTAVVAWARLGQPGAEPAAAVEEVPAVLADGSPPQPVPPEVAAAVDAPAVGAQRLAELPDHMRDACMEHNEITWDPGSPDIEYAFVTADGMTTSLLGTGEVPGGFGRGPRGEEPTGLRVQCDLQFDNGRLVNHGGGYEEVFAGMPRHGGFTSSCCDGNGLATASAALDVPGDADWLLQDRGSWFQAYEVADLEVVTVTWKYREPRMGPGGPGGPAGPVPSPVLFVAADGTVVAETTAGNRF